MKEKFDKKITRREFLSIGSCYLAGLALPEILHSKVPYISHGDRTSDKIALTIDDGWSPKNVDKTMKILNKTPASFFIVGTCIENDPELYKDAVKKGFEIHNHSYRHAYMSDPDTNITQEINFWENAYHSLGAGDYTNKIFRPPANEGVNDPSLYSTLGKLGYKAVIGWTYASPGVYKNSTKNDVLDHIIPKLSGGDIILMHFTKTDMDALPDIIKETQNKGLEFVTLSKMPGTPIYSNTNSDTILNKSSSYSVE